MPTALPLTSLHRPTSKELISGLLDARAVELDLLKDLTDRQMLGKKMHFVEPPIWEMGHVGWTQEWWILRNLDRCQTLLPGSDSIYDSFNVSYKSRWDHRFPSRHKTLEWMKEALDRSIRRIQGREPNEEEAYLYQFVAQHEQMHSESLTLIRQNLGYPCPRLSIAPKTRPPIPVDKDFKLHDVDVAGGTFLRGALKDYPFVFDNEKWAHLVPVEPFRIAAAPVTNGEYIEFVQDGGYQSRALWGKHGWEWRRREQADAPVYWKRDGKRWLWRRFDQWRPLDPWHPVIHVNWYEAKAYCKWSTRRLPTESEWEYAASAEPGADRKRMYPWGDEPPTPELANLDYRHMGTVDVRAYPAGDSAFGCRQMVGNVWEWVEDTFQPYPGFIPDPYREYSLPYFGNKKVLKGGCWATRSSLIRNSWRNFYKHQRRNIFAGFRTVAL